MLIKVSTAESAKTEEVVLNIKGMTCAGCEAKVKAALSSFEGVSDVNVSHKEGKAHLNVEEGKVDKAVLIQAVKQVGFTANIMMIKDVETLISTANSGTNECVLISTYFSQSLPASL